MTKKINFKNVIAMLMTVLMVMSVMVASFGSFIIVNATTETSSKATGESSGEPTRNTGKQSTTLGWTITDRGTSSGNPWYGNTITFYYEDNHTAEFRDSGISVTTPSWFTTASNITMFEASYSSGFSVTDKMYTNWLYLVDNKPTTDSNGNTVQNGYRAICMDPVFNSWKTNDGLISTSNGKLSKIIRIDNDAETTSGVPEEYKIMRRLLWYTYFGGGGLASSYADQSSSFDTSHPASLYDFYNYSTSNNITNNKILGYLINQNIVQNNANGKMASMHAQYVFLHVAASYISELSVAKQRNGGYGYNNSTYPALGYYTGSNDNGRAFTSSTYGTVTVKPTLADNFNNTTWTWDSMKQSSAGWSLIRAYNSSASPKRQFKHLTTTTRTKIANYVQSLRASGLGDSIPDGFTVYVCVPNDTEHQTYAVYTIENRVQIQVGKTYSVASGSPTPSGTVSPAGAKYKIYRSLVDANNNQNSIKDSSGNDVILEIGSTATNGTYYSNIWGETLETIHLELSASGGVCRMYNYYVKEYAPPSNVPDGYIWTMDTTAYEISVTGIGCGVNGFVDHIYDSNVPDNFLYIRNSNNVLSKIGDGYFKIIKESNPPVPASYIDNAQFTLYSDPDCTQVITDAMRKSGNSWIRISNGVVNITNGESPLIKIPMNGSDQVRRVYIKETKAPDALLGGEYAGTWGGLGQIKYINVPANSETTYVTLTFTDPYTPSYGHFRIHKTANPSTYNSIVTGAKFGVYLDHNCTTPATGLTYYNGTSWVALPTTLVDGVNVPTMTIGTATATGGYSETVKVPMDNTHAVLYVKEIAVPTTSPGGTKDANKAPGGGGGGSGDTWYLNTQVFEIRVQPNHTVTAPYTLPVVNRVGVTFYIAYHINIQIKKQDASGNGHYTDGAKFAVYLSEADAIADTNRLGEITIGYTYYNANNKLITIHDKSLPYTLPTTVTDTTPVDVWIREIEPPITESSDGTWQWAPLTGNEIWKQSCTPGMVLLSMAGADPGDCDNNPSVTKFGFSGSDIPATGGPVENDIQNPYYGYFRVNKRATSLTPNTPQYPSQYVAGAKYGIYLDSACQTPANANDLLYNSGNGNGYATPLPTMTVDGKTVPYVTIGTATQNSNAGGYSQIVQVQLGFNSSNTVTYYVKEIAAPTNNYSGYQWFMDENVYAFTIGNTNTSNRPLTKISTNQMVPLLGYFRLSKILPDPFTDPTGATYTAYTDPECTQIYTGMKKVSGTGTVNATSGTIVFGNNTTGPLIRVGLDIYQDSTRGIVAEKIIYIKETAVPTAYISGDNQVVLDNTVYMVRILPEHVQTQPLNIVSNEPKIVKTYGYLQIYKNVSGGPDGITGEGAVYRVYETQADAENGTNYVYSFNIGPAGLSNIVKVELGWAAENKTYYIKEYSLPNPVPGYSWTIDTNIYPVQVDSTTTINAPEVMADSTNILTSLAGSFSLSKTVDLGTTLYDPTGAVYAIYNSQAAAQAGTGSANDAGLATDIGDGGFITVAKIGRTTYGVQATNVPIASGTTRELWIKEVELPSYNRDGTDDPSWSWNGLDPTIHHVTVTSGSNTAFTSENSVHLNSTSNVYVKVTKTVTGAIGETISPQGATYGIFASEAAARAADSNTTVDGTSCLDIVTIGANGVSNVSAIDIGYNSSIIVYIKELTTPADGTYYTWNIDTNVYTVPLTANDNGTVNSAFNVNSTNSVSYRNVSLTITKTVTGNMGDKAQSFTFSVYIVGAGGTPLNGVYTAQLNGNNTTVNIRHGRFTITLSHGDVFYLGGLPYGSHYTVTETVPANYTMTSTNSTGILYGDKTAAFVNDCSTSVPTGIPMTLVTGLALLLSSGAGIALMRKKRKDNE